MASIGLVALEYKMKVRVKLDRCRRLTLKVSGRVSLPYIPTVCGSFKVVSHINRKKPNNLAKEVKVNPGSAPALT